MIVVNNDVQMTGGILCENHPETIKVLDTMTSKEQIDWLRGIRLSVEVY